MTQPEQSTDPSTRLAARLAKWEARLTALERRGQRIPILDDDPGPDDYTNIWMLNDGRLRVKDAQGNVHEFVPAVDYRPVVPTFASDPAVSTGWRAWLNGATGQLRVYNSSNVVKQYNAVAATAAPDGGTGSAGGSTTTVPKPAVVQRTTHVSVWSADDANCYCPVHGVESDLYYGRYSATHGERRLMFGFDATAIRSAITSQGWILKIELKVTNLHSYANSGIQIHWGGHNIDTLGSGFSQRYADVWMGHWPKSGGGTWRVIPTWFGEALRDGLIRGLTVDQPSASISYYGLLRSDLQLRITYSNFV